MTANTLYEAVEPRVLWKQLFSIVLSDLNSTEERVDVCQLKFDICFTSTENSVGHTNGYLHN